jgi:hypothetical protein
MQNSELFTRGWQVTFCRMIEVRLNRCWLLPTVIVIVALGIGIMPTARVVQAQNGGTGSGQQVSAAFVLQVDTSGLTRNRLCIGDTRPLPIKVKLRSLQFTDIGGIGGLTIRGAAIDTEVGNASVLQVQPSASTPAISPNAPFETHINITGREAGTTTITVSATVESNLWVTSSQPSPVTVTIQVVPCEYRLDATSIWVTTVYGNASAIMSLSLENVRLTSRDGIRFDNVLSNVPQVRFDTTVNRIRGCPVGHYTNHTEAPEIRGEVIDGEIFLTIPYQEVPLGSPGTPYDTYYYDICPITVPPLCEAHPDGVCHIWRGVDRIVPQAMENISFPIDGGTIHPSHTLNYTEQRPLGSIAIDGGTTIKLTPILPQTSQ